MCDVAENTNSKDVDERECGAEAEERPVEQCIGRADWRSAARGGMNARVQTVCTAPVTRAVRVPFSSSKRAANGRALRGRGAPKTSATHRKINPPTCAQHVPHRRLLVCAFCCV